MESNYTCLYGSVDVRCTMRQSYVRLIAAVPDPSLTVSHEVYPVVVLI